MTHTVRRIARQVAATIREMNEAQRRMTVLFMSAERHLANPGAAPDTYEEFMLRTSGPLMHEPSARRRAARARGPRHAIRLR